MTHKKGFQMGRIGLVLAACTLLLVGCVDRKLTINTEPQGALITLNDEEIGTSPVTVGFEWYGDYKVRAAKEGYEILNTHRKLDRPAHDKFPLDFFAEVSPSRIKDRYEWTFELTPWTPPDRDQLIRDAETLKNEAVRIP
ncbi:MAG: PEGA domain-containing protein [Phycisphaerae bacterium]|nr:PEGA domain-containing protein [Phycisphaerae bacterium]